MNNKIKKGPFIAIWSDDDHDAYLFDTKGEAIKTCREELKNIDLIAVGTVVKIYNLSKVECIKEMEKTVKGSEG